MPHLVQVVADWSHAKHIGEHVSHDPVIVLKYLPVAHEATQVPPYSLLSVVLS